MPGHSSFRALCRYEDILQETLIIRHNESEILPALIIADDPLGSPLYDFRDLSFSSHSFRCFGDDNLYLISLPVSYTHLTELSRHMKFTTYVVVGPIGLEPMTLCL